MVIFFRQYKRSLFPVAMITREKVCNIFEAYCAFSQIEIRGIDEGTLPFKGASRKYTFYKFESKLGEILSIGFEPTYILLDGEFVHEGVTEMIHIIFRNHTTEIKKSFEFTSLDDFKARLPNFLDSNADFQRRVVELLEKIVSKLEKQ